MKNCLKCGREINPKRLEILPNTKTCVECSDVNKKGGITVQLGEGDHTWNEVIIMEPEELMTLDTKSEPVDLEYLSDEGESFPTLTQIKSNLDYDKEELEEDLEEYIEEKEEDEDADS